MELAKGSRTGDLPRRLYHKQWRMCLNALGQFERADQAAIFKLLLASMEVMRRSNPHLDAPELSSVVSERASKYLAFVKDKRTKDPKQISATSLPLSDPIGIDKVQVRLDATPSRLDAQEATVTKTAQHRISGPRLKVKNALVKDNEDAFTEMLGRHSDSGQPDVVRTSSFPRSNTEAHPARMGSSTTEALPPYASQPIQGHRATAGITVTLNSAAARTGNPAPLVDSTLTAERRNNKSAPVALTPFPSGVESMQASAKGDLITPKRAHKKVRESDLDYIARQKEPDIRSLPRKQIKCIAELQALLLFPEKKPTKTSSKEHGVAEMETSRLNATKIVAQLTTMTTGSTAVRDLWHLVTKYNAKRTRQYAATGNVAIIKAGGKDTPNILRTLYKAIGLNANASNSSTNAQYRRLVARWQRHEIQTCYRVLLASMQKINADLLNAETQEPGSQHGYASHPDNVAFYHQLNPTKKSLPRNQITSLLNARLASDIGLGLSQFNDDLRYYKGQYELVQVFGRGILAILPNGFLAVFKAPGVHGRAGDILPIVDRIFPELKKLSESVMTYVVHPIIQSEELKIKTAGLEPPPSISSIVDPDRLAVGPELRKAPSRSSTYGRRRRIVPDDSSDDDLDSDAIISTGTKRTTRAEARAAESKTGPVEDESRSKRQKLHPDKGETDPREDLSFLNGDGDSEEDYVPPENQAKGATDTPSAPTPQPGLLAQSHNADVHSANESCTPKATKCVACSEPLPEGFELKHGEEMKAFADTRPRFSVKHPFCDKHRKMTYDRHRTEYDQREYPEIDFGKLVERCEGMKDRIKTFITKSLSQPSVFRDKLKKEQAEHRNLLAALQQPDSISNHSTPGYYGPKGSEIMEDWLLSKFSAHLSRQGYQDPVMSSWTIHAYASCVLVPELGSMLIQADRRMETIEEARKLMLESAALGRHVWPIENEAAASSASCSNAQESVEEGGDYP